MLMISDNSWLMSALNANVSAGASDIVSDRCCNRKRFKLTLWKLVGHFLNLLNSWKWRQMVSDTYNDHDLSRKMSLSRYEKQVRITVTYDQNGQSTTQNLERNSNLKPKKFSKKNFFSRRLFLFLLFPQRASSTCFLIAHITVTIFISFSRYWEKFL